MAKVYDETLTAAQVAVAREYRKVKKELESDRESYESAKDEWAAARQYLEPRLTELRQGLVDMGLDPADFD